MTAFFQLAEVENFKNVITPTEIFFLMSDLKFILSDQYSAAH